MNRIVFLQKTIENYFDIVPGVTKTVRILGKNKSVKIIAKPWYSSKSTTISWNQ